MREIKFRVWGGDVRKYFVYFGLYGQQSGYFTDEFIQPDGSQHVIDYDDVIAIQQFTGLRDKNGKEIWEGDIVRTDAGACLQVQYDHFQLCELEAQIADFDEENKWFVIGNIYENPELLTPTAATE